MSISRHDFHRPLRSTPRRWPLLLAACLPPLLGSCASTPAPEPDEVVDRVIAEDAARAAAAQPLENTYPDLREVPPRPMLGYTVEQRRQIQEGLVADLDYANRTSELVRTTEGATPPPPPASPDVVPGVAEAMVAKPAPRPPSQVVLIERRDTSGNLSSFLNDVVGIETEVDSAQGQVSVPPGSGRNPRPGPAPVDGLTGQEVEDATGGTPAGDSEPGFFTALAGLFGGSADETVTVTPDPADSASAAEPLAIGRRWELPLSDGSVAPAGLARLITDVSAPGALQGRKLSVAAHEAGSAEAVARELLDQGVPPDLVETGPALEEAGNAVIVSVLPTGG